MENNKKLGEIEELDEEELDQVSGGVQKVTASITGPKSGAAVVKSGAAVVKSGAAVPKSGSAVPKSGSRIPLTQTDVGGGRNGFLGN